MSEAASAHINIEVVDSVKMLIENMSKVNESLIELSQQVNGMRTEIDSIKDLKASLEFTQAALAVAENKIEGLKANCEERRREQISAAKEINFIKMENADLKERLLRLDCYIRRENLKISGVPEDTNETNQQCKQKIYDIFSKDLDMRNSSNIQIQRCHRLGYRKAGQNRDIIVRFTNYPEREQIWSNKNKLKGTKIFMKEDFSPEIECRHAKLYPILKAALKQQLKARLVMDKLVIEGITYTVDSLDALPESLKLKNLATRDVQNSILFYGKDSVFSSFYPTKFQIGGQIFNSTEQYFQFRKAECASSSSAAEEILKSKDATEIHRIGRKIQVSEDNWNNKKAKEIMEIAVREKFTQNEILKTELLTTGNKCLISCNKYDKLWGIGLSLFDKNAHLKKQWKGENALGTILTRVRDNLK